MFGGAQNPFASPQFGDARNLRKNISIEMGSSATLYSIPWSFFSRHLKVLPVKESWFRLEIQKKNFDRMISKKTQIPQRELLWYKNRSWNVIHWYVGSSCRIIIISAIVKSLKNLVFRNFIQFPLVNRKWEWLPRL